MQIVFLDSSTLPERFPIPKPERQHEWRNYASTNADQVLERCQHADIVVTNKVPLGAEVLRQCKKITHIAVAATGYNIIDIETCRELKISVSNIREYAGVTVPEHVLMCALQLRRNLSRYQQLVAQGDWQKSSQFCVFDQPIQQLHGSLVGIIGFGSLGQATANLMRAVGAEVIVHSRRQVENYPNASLDELLAKADIISVHCTLNESSKNLIGDKELSLMSAQAILINTARGGIVNETALARAIENQSIAAAAIDVLSTEPPQQETRLLALANRDNVIITPHIAWASEAALEQLVTILGDNIRAFIQGTPQNLVT